jgi:hypothetical protein
LELCSFAQTIHFSSIFPMQCHIFGSIFSRSHLTSSWNEPTDAAN